MEAEWLRPRRRPRTPGAAVPARRGLRAGLAQHPPRPGGQPGPALRADVLAINYRKAPDHPFPAALEDALLAYYWLLARGHSPPISWWPATRPGAGWCWRCCSRYAKPASPCPPPPSASRPGPTCACPRARCAAFASEESLLLEALEMRSWGPLYAADTPLTPSAYFARPGRVARPAPAADSGVRRRSAERRCAPIRRPGPGRRHARHAAGFRRAGALVAPVLALRARGRHRPRPGGRLHPAGLANRGGWVPPAARQPELDQQPRQKALLYEVIGCLWWWLWLIMRCYGRNKMYVSLTI